MICNYEIVYVTESDEILSEAAVRQWKKMGQKVVKKYRCMAGPKEGKLVSEPSACGTRKDPKKVRQGKKIMRSKKGTIARKTKVSKKKSMSKMVTRMNKRLMGEGMDVLEMDFSTFLTFTD